MNKLMKSPTIRWAAIALVVVAVALGAFLAGRSTGGQSVQAQQEQTTTSSAPGPLGDQARREEGDIFALGDPEAPISMVVYSDYRCPFCARYSNVSEPVIIERFVESGQVRMEWRDFPVFGDASMLGARAGRAAAEQGLFWEFNEAVFAAAPSNAHHDLTPEKLLGFAEQVGVPDLERFEEEMLSEDFDEEIASDMLQGRMLGISGTPSFVIGGYALVGAQPTEVFIDVIEQTLAEVQ